MQRVGHPLEGGRAELVALRGQQAPGDLDELSDRLALSGQSVPERAGVPAAGQKLRLGGPSGVAGLVQFGHGATLGADQLVDRPGRKRRLAQSRHRLGLFTLTRLPQRFGQRGPLGDEALEGKPVEIVSIHPRQSCRDGDRDGEARAATAPGRRR